MTHFPAQLSTDLLMQAVNPAARALVLAGATGVVLSAFRVKATSIRLQAWTAVLYAALALPFLGWVLPTLSVPVPAVLSTVVAPSGVHNSQATGADSSVGSPVNDEPQRASVTSAPATDVTHVRAHSAKSSSSLPEQRPGMLATIWSSISSSMISWSTIAIAVYLGVALLLLARLFVGMILSRRLIRRSRLVTEFRLTQRLRSHARASNFAPRAVESGLISVPLTTGVFRSTILLPATWREWDDAKLDAVVAHEVSHVARRDALTQCLSLLHRAIFWFSPLPWWLDRHLTTLAEEAADEAALSDGADRNDYARTLLSFFEALHAAPGRVRWQGVSMASAGEAEKRVERILAWRGAVTMNVKKSILVAIIALAIPVVYLAAAARPVSPALQAQTNVQTPAPPPSARAPLPPAAAIGASPAVPQFAPVAPVAGVLAARARALVAPVAAVAPFPPLPPLGGQSTHSYGYGSSYTYGDDDYQRFVIVTAKSDSLTMSGSTEDARHAEKLKKQIAGDFIWFERDEKSYIIRDQATIERARKLWAPQEELGRQQEELGKQQEELGKQQEALGKKMEEIRVSIPDMTAEMDRLKAKLQKLGSNASVEQLGELQSEIGELQSKIGEVQSHAGDQQSKLGEEMGALGEKQGKLGELQGKLGEQQGELSEKASHQMKEIFDEAIKNGTAQPERDNGGGGTL